MLEKFTKVIFLKACFELSENNLIDVRKQVIEAIELNGIKRDK